MRTRRDAGFTLVEILAALSIFLVVLAASYALFESGRGLAQHGEHEARRHQAARAAISALERDLRHVLRPGATYDSGFIGKSGGTAELPADTLDLVGASGAPRSVTPASTSPTATPEPVEIDLVRAAWSIDDDASTKASGLVRKRTRLLTEVSALRDPEEGLEEVSADVVGLKLRYYDGSAWQETWDSTQSGTLPKAVEIVVHVRAVWRGKEEVEIFSTKVYLPVAARTPKKS